MYWFFDYVFFMFVYTKKKEKKLGSYKLNIVGEFGKSLKLKFFLIKKLHWINRRKIRKTWKN